MTPTNAERGPRQGPATAQIAAPHEDDQHRERTAAVRVAGTFYAPAGRRRFGVLIVTRCPFCPGVHLHRGNGGVRRAGCGRGDYIVEARSVLNAGRGAA